jgi:hypothetical protein
MAIILYVRMNNLCIPVANGVIPSAIRYRT